MRVIALLVAASPAFAENTVTLHATYLDAPTEWCAGNEGVPVLIEMDGPDIAKGPIARTYHRVRRGTEITHIEVKNPEHFIDGSEDILGRFSASLQGCQSPWGSFPLSGSWAIDGDEPISGYVQKRYIASLSGMPFFQLDREAGAYSAELGEASFFAAYPIQLEKTLTHGSERE